MDPDPNSANDMFFIADMFENPPDTPRVVDASLTSSEFQVHSTAGPSGNFAATGRSFVPGTISTFAEIEERPIFSPPDQDTQGKVTLNIDYGFMRLVGGGHSTMRLDLYLRVRIRNFDGDLIRLVEWNSFAELTSDNFDFPVLTTGGADIGIHMSGVSEAEIPGTVVHVDLGTIPAESILDYRYQFGLRARSPSPEVVRWSYSDPLALDGDGEKPDLEFQTVPEPATLAATVLGLAMFSLRRRSRS